ncbi:Spy/CpxP family protein refolding chaperone [Cyanobacterium stanieri LEGE 03274]|uniref:Spy/CpxP family protein refolding chaperone n=1 Tax=Cyanobacterium stanieri LEGE 03274 TaxID=1828756 RepID=A0ABR9V269_9CHRO|nr:Spy/CpxP family protein refolding chaperone [Cyanobacterium stanieri]MBE9221973.1 Spy/CpxP family protein refolding chaperone [Cyanobacterium stanieri LEGE 03274]
MKNNIRHLFALTMLLTFTGGARAIALDADIISLENTLNETIELAQGKEENKRWGAKKEGQSRLIQQLNLTPEQQQQMLEIKNRYEPRMTNLRQEIRTERQELRTMMNNNESTEAIRAKNQTISNLTQQMRELGFETMLEMREVLTPAQREELSQIMNQRRSSNRPNR